MTDSKKLLIGLILSLCFIQTASCQNEKFKDRLKGEWSYDGKEKLFSLDPYYDQVVEIMENDRIIFHGGHLEIKSGIFLLTKEEWPKGHYPWIYCGNKTQYRVRQNELSIYHPGLKAWKKFSIQMITDDSLVLSTDARMHSLVRKNARSFSNDIESIHLKVFDVEPFFVGFEVHVENDKINMFQDNVRKEATSKAYVDYIFKGFDRVDMKTIDEFYNSELSENRILDLDIVYNGGKKVHSKIIGNSYPDDLKHALLPIIYAGDFINHKEYWSDTIN